MATQAKFPAALPANTMSVSSGSPDAVPGEDFEYAAAAQLWFGGELEADVHDSYEALPANYGLGHNMLAGAFAGIAV